MLFIITLIVNALSRVLIWSMNRRSRRPSRGAAVGCTPSGAPHEARRRVAGSSRRSSSACARSSVLVALVPLAFILFFVVTQGIQALNLDFFTHMPAPVGEAGRRHGERDRRHADADRAWARCSRCRSASSAASTCRSSPAPGSRRPCGSRPTRSTACRRSSSACSSTASRCCR